jgi:hypothetical protein
MSNEPSPPRDASTTKQLPYAGDTSSSAEIESGTGWPDQSDPAVDSTRPVSATPASFDPDEPPQRKGFIARRTAKWGRRGFWLASLAGIIVILLIATTVLGRWPHLSNPFAAKTTDRSGPVLLVSIQDLARFEAASGNFQVIVDIQNDHKYIPDIILSDRSLFVAAGTVEAYVDFSNVGPNDVVTNADRTVATITLPAPQLGPAAIDNSRSYVYSESSGIINKLQNLIGGDPNKQQELYLYAQQKISAAAVDSQLAQRASDNTRSMLQELLRSLGFTTITINFAAN